MSTILMNLGWFYSFVVMALFVIGLYCIVATKNMVRVLIGIELMIKAATLLLVVAGRQSGNLATAQSLIITLIVVEVVIMIVAGGMVMNVFRANGSIDTAVLRKLKG